ncbi:MAG TPA: glycosyltransferase [Blastocatellia bacterium]|jgi:glycosyltransferase involved in cell wall biosynthesis|nr:glycosyltransferase [Blastocatellia bacterium]
MNPTASVILPTYNRGKTLKRAVDSVLAQTFDDFELIIIDDKSADQTPEILRAYATQRRVRLVSQLRRGCAEARNIGVLASRGRYIAFQDSDDEWVPTKLGRAIEALEGSGPEVGVFYSDMLRVEANGNSYHFHSPDVRKGLLINDETLDYQVHCIGIQSAVIKRECFDKAGLFDEALPRLIDLELFIRLSDHFEFLHCKEPLVRYYDCEGISTNAGALVSARRYLMDKYRQRLEEHRCHLISQQLHLRVASQMQKNDRASSQLAEMERELEKITGSPGWRMLTRYGRLKYRYLLPLYRLLRLKPSESRESK